MTAISGKSDQFESDFLLLLFNNTNMSLVGDATGLRGSSTAGSLYLSLHTADPTEEGDQTTNEISYTGYLRVAVARSSGGWTVSGNSVTLAALTAFAKSTGGTGGTATHFGVGASSSGAGKLLYGGAISPTILVASGVTPELTTSTVITES